MATAESPATPGQLLSERIAPGILPKVLGPFDMVAIFVAIVLFANQGSVIQAAGPAGFVYWILGFVTFLIPGAIVTGQLGLMFPGEGSIYVWTHKALGNFWGFFAGFCAWWPGILVMVATADLIVTMLQFLNSSNATFYGLVILALLGIEVPLNMGVEIKDRRAITSYLFWGSIVVMAAYLLLTFGAMVVVPQKDANSTTAILQAVQIALGSGVSTVVTLILIAFFLFNTTVYNYSFARLLFVSGLDRRLPQAMGRVNRNKVPHIAVLTQAVITTIITVLTFIVFSGNPNLSTQVYLVLQAAVTVIWCLSMVMLFVDVLVIRSKFPTEFKREQLAPSGVFVAASVAGAVASGAGIWVTLTGSWNPQLIANGPWLLIVGGVTVVSLVVAVIVYLIGVTRKTPTATIQPSTA